MASGDEEMDEEQRAKAKEEEGVRRHLSELRKQTKRETKGAI